MDTTAIPAFWYYMIAVQICGIISTILGFVFAWMRDNRNRQWDVQDRAIARERTEGLIKEAKTDAKAAFVEANHAKQLISSIEEVRNNIQSKTLDLVNGVQESTEKAAETLEEIKENTGISADALSKPIHTIPIPKERRK